MSCTASRLRSDSVSLKHIKLASLIQFSGVTTADCYKCWEQRVYFYFYFLVDVVLAAVTDTSRE